MTLEQSVNKDGATCWEECVRCKSVELAWVHGHSQCRMCGMVLEGCCGGEQQVTVKEENEPKTT